MGNRGIVGRSLQKLSFPTPEDRLLFILVYVKTYALQVVQGRLFKYGPSKANQWIPVLLPACWQPCAPSAMPPPAR